MSPNTRLLLYALLAVVALIVLIARFKLHPFVVLIVVSLAMGAAAGMPLGTVLKAFQDGVGGVLALIAIVVGLGTMLGKLMAESGGATRIATTLIALFGERRVHWAIMFVGFIVGIPVFFQVGFVLLIPLVFTIARQSGLSLVKIGIPLVAGLSVVHGMVPPHPAAMLAVGAYHADVGRTIAYALLVGLPTAALAGPLFASWIAPRITLPAANPIAAQFASGGDGGDLRRPTPSFGVSLFTVLLPVILMLCASAADVALEPTSPVRAALDFVGGPIVALLVALVFAFWSLGFRQHFTRDQILKFANDCLAPTATILLVIGAGGGFNRVLVESGVGKAIADVALGSQASPLLLAWTVAALIRVATGSATVAMTTSAGIVAPIAAATPGTSPELLVLATGAGSLVLSHVNDSGFWLIKEFFNMTVPQTLKTWTVAETIIGVAGLGFTMLLSLLVGCARPDQSATGPWIDVTATLDPAKTPVYQGDAPMKFDFLKDMRRGDNFTLSVYSMGAHSGTHIDAPMHFIRDGAAIDQVGLDPLIGPARVIDIADSVQAIDAAELNRHDWKGAKRVLFRTRSTLRGWMDSAFHKDFAYIAPDAAQLLADAGVVLVGVDYISAEQFGAPAPETHRILLGRGIPIVEGLDLRPVQAGDYDLIVLPIKVRGHEGAPARAVMRKRGNQASVGASYVKPTFHVIAFFTGKKDPAHISFLHEADMWFPRVAAQYGFGFDTTSNWDNLNTKFLAAYQVVVFLDTRPEAPAQRAAFQAYMEHGGAWMGFHFAGFALTPSVYPANWDWYHNTFLGSGSYVSNTWRPTAAMLRVEDRAHPATAHLPATFRSSPSEWYRWEKDLRQNPDIDILLSIDSTSFPLGTGPKPHEIWHSGYYPVVWTNRHYRMIYFNMGHNDIDYEHKYDATNRTLSYTLNNTIQDQLIIGALLWLGNR